MAGYYGKLLKINLSDNTTETVSIPEQDLTRFIGGRGLGMKLLWDHIPEPGLDPLSPDNPLIFLAGPFSGFPVASASRTCVVTKSPVTAPASPFHDHASGVSYSNFGGFFGPEIRFAGYEAILVIGRADQPVYLVIDDDRVDIRDAGRFWGMGTDRFERIFPEHLGDRRFRTCYIGPAGENRVPFAGIMHTAARAAGRGVGCVMGAKRLKAIAVRGSRMPVPADPEGLCREAASSRSYYKGISKGTILSYLFRGSGTAFLLEKKSKKGVMTVKNFQEGTFDGVEKIGASAARERLWTRDYACYCCPLACKKSGTVRSGRYKGLLVHDGPEYETGTMLGANLLIDDLETIMKLIFDADDYGLDIISAGNVLGFLMEARDRGDIGREDLDGIDLCWGNGEAAIEMLKKMAYRDGIGELASRGVRALSLELGPRTRAYAIHVKGLELAAHNVQANPAKGLCYATSNRGACHQNGENIRDQNHTALVDCLGVCRFACLPPLGMSVDRLAGLLAAITGIHQTPDDLLAAGERVFNLEKLFNLREGFGPADDCLPDRFFTDALTLGPEKGAVLDRAEFRAMLDTYYTDRGWDPRTTVPGSARLAELELSAFAS